MPLAQPTAFPAEPDAWPAYLETTIDSALDDARALLARLKDGTARTATEVLDLWNDADVAIATASSAAHLLAEVHPDAALRAAAEERAQAAEDLVTQRGLDHELWQVLAATDPEGLDAAATRVREHVLRDFRRAGVDRSPEDRERLRALAQRCTELGLEFARNIRDDVRTVRVRPEQLAGLPEDFLAEHPADDEGLVTLTTEYPDLLPVRTYATDPGVRLALTREHQRIGWPANEPVLAELLRLRAERAALLGYPDWPTYDAEVKMIGSGTAIADLVERLDALTAAASAHDVDVMLARYREDVPGATAVTPADNLFYEQVVKSEQYGVDAREVREYFRYEAVKPGVLGVMERLFGIALERVDAPTWHEDVEVYDVTDGGRAIGRVYLDMHPRAGKFNHAAQFPLRPGIAGRSLPEGALVCNFPTGLLEHDDVLTFFHELGHLVHEVLGGHQPWAMFSGVATEWDFVEAPSQLLEEWGWDAGVLASFATNAAGEPIPAALVERMRRADAFARGAWTRRQLNFTALSYSLHADPPVDLASFTADVDARFGPYAPVADSHQYAGFGHLDEYGSAYYTYLWSLVIAKDLRTAFTDGLMDPAVGRRYRETVLEPGGSADAAELVERFLGRPSSFAAFEAWLAEGTTA
ncbi:M3 family metallopeptidase [Cellulomonas cellasea]|uniref:Peptidase M3 n=2 Tax=Cellulomonas cellasea TaxID=43670 RepID=A0A0A0B7A9_9CELL|nr:M3 family metallopeptidase [Cellulomonas cellasea]KGM02750.1 peptidase M3 [Cellulomonas cellasea DSM 20118]GEA86693.1 Zn-dependent oligopeptidase [Cellulomonas cellasea]